MAPPASPHPGASGRHPAAPTPPTPVAPAHPARRREEDARFAEREAADARFGGESPGGGDAHGSLSEEEAESLALAIRLQQEEDDAALRAVSFFFFCWLSRPTAQRLGP